MVRIQEVQSIIEKQDSIKVSKTATGKFSFEVKRYYDFDKTNPEEIIEQIETIYERLERTFCDRKI